MTESYADRISGAVDDYCDHHGITLDDVEITRTYLGDGDLIIGFTLSSPGYPDERFGNTNRD